MDGEARTPSEEILVGIWEQFLKVPGIGAHDDFLALGGNSLVAMQVVYRVRQAFGVQLEIRTVFDLPTVAELAREIDGLAGARAAPTVAEPRAGPQAPAAPPTLPGREIPLSQAQRAFWDPTTRPQKLLRLSGPLDRVALERALTEIVRRHEILRARFAISPAGEPCQWIDPAAGLPLGVTRVDAPAAVDEELRRHLGPIDLLREPAFRLRLLQLGREEHLLLLVFHHIVFDGWSWGVLFRELDLLYSAFRASRPSTLDALPLQYIDFARRPATEDGRRPPPPVWPGEPPRLSCPVSVSGGPGPPGPPLTKSVHLSADTVDRLTAVAHRRQASLAVLILAAYHAMIRRWTGAEKLWMAFPEAGRQEPGSSQLIGCFVRKIVMYTDVSGDPGWPELLDRVRESFFESCGTRPDWAVPEAWRNPPFYFNMMPEPRSTPRLEGLEVVPERLDEPPLLGDQCFILSATWCGRDLSLDLSGNPALVAEGSLQDLVGQLRTVLLSTLETAPSGHSR